jgi:hypothetical protein
MVQASNLFMWSGFTKKENQCNELLTNRYFSVR